MVERRLVLSSAAGLLLAALPTTAPRAQNPLAAQAQAAAAANRLLEDGDLHVILCGTAGPLPGPGRAGPCVAVIAAGRFFVVDAGAGAAGSLGRLALPLERLTGLLLTHFHSDHIADTGELAFAHWTRGAGKEPLEVWGPVGVEQVIAGFGQAYELDTGYRVAHHGPEQMPPAEPAPART